MHMRLLSVLAATTLAACSLSEPATAAHPHHGELARTITVSGNGVATAAPDMAVVNLGVQNRAKTAQEALRQNSAKMRAAIDELKKLGVAEKDIQTSGVSIHPQYDYQTNRSEPKLTGYNASNGVTVKLRDLERAGGIIDKVVASGANTLNNISFGFSKPQPLRDAAQKDAVANARAQAKLLTEAAGVKLGKPVTITSGYIAAPSPQPKYARAMVESDSAVPLQAGESSITASVTIVFEIE